jgi:hypothetical protein
MFFKGRYGGFLPAASPVRPVMLPPGTLWLGGIAQSTHKAAAGPAYQRFFFWQ